jgi:hypothetical protein
VRDSFSGIPLSTGTTVEGESHPDWEPAQRDLVTRKELRRAAELAQGIAGDDLRLGAQARLLARRGVAFTRLSDSLLEDRLAIRRPAVANFVREVLRLASLTVVDDLKDMAGRLADAHAESRERDMAIFVQRYGAGSEGVGASSLQAVASVHGLTRERVRQVVDAMLQRAAAHTILSPAFNRVVEALPSVLPRSELDASDAMRKLLGPKMSAGGALRYGIDVLRAKLPVRWARFERRSGVRTLVWGHAADSRSWLDTALSVATGMVRACGLAYLPRVTSETEAITGQRIGAQGVSSALATIRNLEWLDDRHEWFWFVDETHKNRLALAVRKIMAVARRPVDIEEIYGGIARMRGDRVRLIGVYPPPPWAVQALCSRVSFLKCKQSSRFLPAVEMSIAEELSATELRIYRHMEARAGLGSRRGMNLALVERGPANAMTIQTTLATSPIVKPIDRGVFGLRGWPLDVKMLNRIRAEATARGHERPLDADGPRSTGRVQSSADLRSRREAG